VIPYYLLITIPVLFLFLAFQRTTSSHSTLCVGWYQAEHIRQHNVALPVFFIILYVMLACRSDRMGTDLEQYHVVFDVYARQSMKYFDLWRSESLFRFLNWLVSKVWNNFQFYLAVISAITLIPMVILYCEDRRRSYLKIILFVGMSTFVMMFSGIRQMIAVSLGIVAYFFVRKKKLILFLLVAVTALGFHHSAFMILPMYPLYHIRLKKNHLWFVLPIMAAVFVFNRQIFGALNVLLAQYDESYEAIQMTSTGAYMSLILFMAFAVFSYVVSDESKMDDEMFGLRNFLMLTVVLQCFAPLHTLAMRMNYYYIVFIPITVAKLVDIPKPSMKRISRVAGVIILVYFLWDYISTIYTGYVTGVSALDTVPYIPFWA